MADFAEYESYDGLGLAELVREKQVSPEDLLEAAITRVERRNPALRLYRRLGFVEIGDDNVVYALMEWTPRPAAAPELN